MIAALLVLGTLAAAAPPSCGSPDSGRAALWRIVSTCLDGACPGTKCADTVEVWARSERFVAIRDRKQCGCPPGYVHGLAMPIAQVCGVEDPRRPEGLWEFAWEAAAARIPERDEIALAVNPPWLRTQDQLHIHLVRLLPGARELAMALKPAPVRLDSLARAWTEAERLAGGRGGHGYLVMSEPGGPGYFLAALAAHPERLYTQASCR